MRPEEKKLLNLRHERRVVDARDDMGADEVVILARLMLQADSCALLLDSLPHHCLLFRKLFQF